MALEPLVHIAVESQLILCSVKGGLEPDAEGAGKRSRGTAHRHAHTGVHTDHPVALPAACCVLEAKGDLVGWALHGFQNLLCMGVVAHEYKVGAPVGLEDGQHIRQLTGLQHHEHKVVEVLRGQDVDGAHPVHRGFALRPLADDQTLLVDALLPLPACQQGHVVLFVLQQHMGQFTAQHAGSVHQDPHADAPPS